ncbi:RNA polymerase-associated protein LEO1 [Thelohanellus kitauei]|uniref:RNA polymerase-associated protein LEO1 n=1 Tax=Thelohanellus kitauei TaxID=669202 RepID=A0A0C2NJL6_THEKT|nr:RNA polymerase-associated protein LEO1 [Thelohanellus kitauei]
MEDELFGSGLSSISGDEDIDKSNKEKVNEPSIYSTHFTSGDGLALEEETTEEVTDYMPFYDINMGKRIYLSKLPNFVSVDPSPFDPSTYEAEPFQDEFTDEEGRVRLKLKMENTIRSRLITDENGEEVRESNSRVIEWSDGSMTLHVGSEIFDIIKSPLPDLQTQIYVKQGQMLVCHGLIDEKLGFKPHSIASETHKRVTLGVADRISRSHKVRIIPAALFDPEKDKLERIRAEENREKEEMKKQKRSVSRKEKRANGDLDEMFDDELDEIGKELDEYDDSDLDDDDIFSTSSGSGEEVLKPSSKKKDDS